MHHYQQHEARIFQAYQMHFTNPDEYPTPPPSTTKSSTDSQHADVQSESNPACWGAVCAGADWSLSSPSPTPTSSQKKISKLRTALECISSRATTIHNRTQDKSRPRLKNRWPHSHTKHVIQPNTGTNLGRACRDVLTLTPSRQFNHTGDASRPCFAVEAKLRESDWTPCYKLRVLDVTLAVWVCPCQPKNTLFTSVSSWHMKVYDTLSIST